MDYNLVEIVRIVMVVLTMWGVALTYSTFKLIRKLLKIRGRCRKGDIAQGLAALGFVIFSSFILFIQPTLIFAYLSPLMAICIGTLFAYIYISERQIHCSKTVNQLKK